MAKLDHRGDRDFFNDETKLNVSDEAFISLALFNKSLYKGNYLNDSKIYSKNSFGCEFVDMELTTNLTHNVLNLEETKIKIYNEFYYIIPSSTIDIVDVVKKQILLTNGENQQ